VTGYEAAWRPAGGGEWTTVVSGAATRLQIDDLASIHTLPRSRQVYRGPSD
jgi:hypothetical protein